MNFDRCQVMTTITGFAWQSITLPKLSMIGALDGRNIIYRSHPKSVQRKTFCIGDTRLKMLYIITAKTATGALKSLLWP